MEQINFSNFWCQTEDNVNSCPRGQILMATYEGYEIHQPVFTQVHSMPPSIVPTWRWSYRKPNERQTWTQLIGEPVGSRLVGRLDGIVEKLDNIPKASRADKCLNEPRDSRSLPRAEKLTVATCDVNCQTEPERCEEQTVSGAAVLNREQVEASPKERDTSRAITKGKSGEKKKKNCKRKSKIKDCSVEERKVRTTTDKSRLRGTNKDMTESTRRHVWKQLLRIEMKPNGDVQKSVKTKPNVPLKKVAKNDKLNCHINGIKNAKLNLSVKNKNRCDRERPGTVEKQDLNKRLKFGNETNKPNQDLDDFIKNVKVPCRLVPTTNKQKTHHQSHCDFEKSKFYKEINFKQRVAKSLLKEICCSKYKQSPTGINEDSTKKQKLQNQSYQTLRKCPCKSKKRPASGPSKSEVSSGHAGRVPKERQQTSPRKTSLQRSVCEKCGKFKQKVCNERCNDDICPKQENNIQPQTPRKSPMRLCIKCGNNAQVCCEKIHAKSSTKIVFREELSKQIYATCTIPEEFRDVALNRKKSVQRIDDSEQTQDSRFKSVGERKSCKELEMQPSKTFFEESEMEQQKYKKAISEKNIDIIRSFESCNYGSHVIESSDDEKCKRNTVSLNKKSTDNINILYKTQHEKEKNDAPPGENTYKVLDKRKSLKEKINQNPKVNANSVIKELLDRRRDIYNEKQKYERAVSEENIDIIRSFESKDDEKCKRNTVSLNKKSTDNINILYKTQHENEKNDAPPGENTYKVLDKRKSLKEKINQNPKVNANSVIKELLDRRRDIYNEKRYNIARYSNQRGLSKIDVQALVSEYQKKTKNEEICKENDKIVSKNNNTKVITNGKCMRRKRVQMNFDKNFYGVLNKKFDITPSKSRNVFKKELKEGIKKTYSDQVWNAYSALMEGDRKIFTKSILGTDSRRNVSLESKYIKLSQKELRSLHKISMAREHWKNKKDKSKTEAQGENGHQEINATENVERGNGQESTQIENSMTLQEINEQESTKEDMISSKQNIAISTTHMERLQEIIMKKRRERLNTLEQLGQTIDNISTMMTTLSPKLSSNSTNEIKDRQASDELISSSNCDRSDDMIHNKSSNCHRSDDMIHNESSNCHKSDDMIHNKSSNCHKSDDMIHNISSNCHKSDDMIHNESSNCHKSDDMIHNISSNCHKSDDMIHNISSNCHKSDDMIHNESSNWQKSDDIINEKDPEKDLFEMFINSTPFIEFKRVAQTICPRHSSDSVVNFTNINENGKGSAETVVETLNDEITDEETELIVRDDGN